MKKLIFSIGILVFILVMGVFSLFILNNVKNNITGQLQNITVLVESEDYETALKKSDALYEYFKEKSDIMIVFIKHDSIEELEETLSRLSPLIKNQDKSEFLAEVSKAEGLAEKLFEHEVPSIKNIF